MYILTPKFIELHLKDYVDRSTIIIRVDDINDVTGYPGKCSVIRRNELADINVMESTGEIMALLQIVVASEALMLPEDELSCKS